MKTSLRTCLTKRTTMAVTSNDAVGATRSASDALQTRRRQAVTRNKVKGIASYVALFWIGSHKRRDFLSVHFTQIENRKKSLHSVQIGMIVHRNSTHTINESQLSSKSQRKLTKKKTSGIFAQQLQTRKLRINKKHYMTLHADCETRPR